MLDGTSLKDQVEMIVIVVIDIAYVYLCIRYTIQGVPSVYRAQRELSNIQRIELIEGNYNMYPFRSVYLNQFI
jgi:hypothetical protein